MERDFLYQLLTTCSVSGHEEYLQEKTAAYVEGFADQVMTDAISDVTGIINPDSKKKVQLSAHADEIGLAVTQITDKGMLHVTKIGGIYVNTYLGQKVRVMHEGKTVYGAVLNVRPLGKKEDLEPMDLIIDIGASSKEEAKAAVALGDPVIFDTDYRELLGDRLCARALDDRIGVFIIMEALKRAKERGCRAGVYASATAGEETTKHGAYWTAARIQPDCTIVVDVTYTSDYQGTDERECGVVELGAGPVLCNNPIVDKKINKKLMEIAERKQIPYQIETSGGRTCTDADEIHLAGLGVPVALVSIPLRYMHNPAEVCSMGDVENCVELIAGYLCEAE